MTDILSASCTEKPDSKVATPILALYCTGNDTEGGAAATDRLMVRGASTVRASLSSTVTWMLAVLRPELAVNESWPRAALRSAFDPSANQLLPDWLR